MATLPFSPALGSAVAELVDADCPLSHDQLGRHFRESRLAFADPAAKGVTEGKKKRARAVFTAAERRPRAGGVLAGRIVGALGSEGCFRPDSPTYIGDHPHRNLRAALRTQGWEVDGDGTLRPRVLDGLEGAELDEALGQIVRRARTGAMDAALVTGTGKDLLEAVARRVLVDRTGTYPTHGNFPATLFQAFDRLGLPTPPPAAVSSFRQSLDPDPQKSFVQIIYLLGCAVNELRNAQGTGHGRPFPSTVSEAEATAAVQAMGLVAEFLRAQP